jgi:2-keto-4-pentenoate hydratase/2-oxohepta-3-ene-1,7-dioic acid hydratase in catechol pathway
MAFEQHLQNIFPQLGREIPPEWYGIPVYYKGNTASLGAHGQAITMPSYSDDDDFDFEFEFAAVLRRGGTDIPPEQAADHVFGYTIYNDFSARAIQQREMSVGLGPAKSKDFAGAHVLGPCLVTADEIADVYDLDMEARVNGEIWASGSTSGMHWRFEDMIAHASRDEPLRAGEVLGSGTVGGGSAMEVGRSLKSGDEVELTITGLGTLHNHVVRAEKAANRAAGGGRT